MKLKSLITERHFKIKGVSLWLSDFKTNAKNDVLLQFYPTSSADIDVLLGDKNGYETVRKALEQKLIKVFGGVYWSGKNDDSNFNYVIKKHDFMEYLRKVIS